MFTIKYFLYIVIELKRLACVLNILTVQLRMVNLLMIRRLASSSFLAYTYFLPDLGISMYIFFCLAFSRAISTYIHSVIYSTLKTAEIKALGDLKVTTEILFLLNPLTPANLENSAVATGLEKVSFHSNPKESQCKQCLNYCTIALISHANKVMLKILQARLQQYMNRELPDVQAGFRKGRGTRDQIGNICRIIEKAREFQKNIYFCFIDYVKTFDCVVHNKLENSERDRNTRPPDLPLEKPICRSGSNS